MTELKNRREKFLRLKNNFSHLIVNYCAFNVTIKQLKEKYANFSKQELLENNVSESLIFYGRIMAWRDKGKVAFLDIGHVDDSIQCYFKRSALADEGDFDGLDYFDLNDVVAIKGNIMRTHVGELSIKVQNFYLLSKSYKSLFDKYRGLKDTELRYRKRYIDFIANSQSKEILRKRAKIISLMRSFLEQRDFLEVETPVLHAILGGANALPFVTRHNTLKQDFYLRVAPELYLKRLIVGGFNKVFEIGRLFRNEGISRHHNPEFTSIEIYEAFSNMKGMMDLTESMLQYIVKRLFSSYVLTYQTEKIDFTQFDRLTMKEALKKYGKIDFNLINNDVAALELAKQHHIDVPNHQKNKYAILVLLYEKLVEHQLVQPTFIYEFPTISSPLSKQNTTDENFVDRFELIICGKEYANSFSELTDPFEQEKRFEQQLAEKAKGNLEACEMDYDYLEALQCGLVATGGLGIGIDRLIMLLTNQANIREVIAFPTLRTGK